MFGMSLEKLVLVVLIAAVLIGPTRLPAYARGLASLLRSTRRHVDAATARLEQDTGLSREQWNPEEWRRYDPREIVRSALREVPASAPPAPSARDAEPVGAEGVAEHEVSSDTPTPDAPETALLSSPATLARIRPGQRFVVIGNSAHPTRIALDTLPEDHPARRAARTEDDDALVTDARVADPSAQYTFS